MRYISDYKDNLFFINALNEPTKVWKIKLVPLARVKDEAYGYAYKEMDEALAINEEFIQSWDMSQELCEGNFNFGNFNSNTLKIILNNKIMAKYDNYENEYKRYFNNTTFVGGCYRIKYSLLCKTDKIDEETGKYITKYVDITMGSFICNKCSKEETKITLEFNDYATRFDNPIDTTQEIAKNGDDLKIIVQRICLLNNMRYPITFTNCDYRLTKTPNLERVATYRQLICYIAQLAGCNAIMDHDGYLQFRDFGTEESFLIDKTKYMTNSRADYGFSGFGKVILRYTKTVTTTNENGEIETKEEEKAIEKGENVGTILDFEVNPLYDGNQIVIDNIYDKIKDISFYPCSFNIDINPLIELGDKFSWENWECSDYYNDKGELIGNKIKRYAYVTNISYSSFKQSIECLEVENGGASRMTSSTSGTTGGGYGGSNVRPGPISDIVNLNNNIFVDNLESSFAKIDFANITKAVITDAMIHDLTADKITSGTINANVIYSGEVVAGKIVSTDPETGESTYINGALLKTGTVVADRVSSDFIYTGDLKAEQIKTGKLNADVVYSGAIKTNQLEAGGVKVGKSLIEPHCITSDEINTEKLVIPGSCIQNGTITTNKMDANEIFTNKILAGSIVSEDKEGKKTYINGDFIQSGTIAIEKVDSDFINSIEISADQITSGKISGDIIEGITITGNEIIGGEITGDVVFSGTLGACKIVADDFKLGWGHIKFLETEYADITNLIVDSLNSEDIVTNTIKADNISGGILKLSKGMQIVGETKFNESGNIEQASLVLTGDLLQMKNLDGSAGIQIGKDSNNEYGIVIWDDKGNTLFNSTSGGIQSEGLPSEIVTSDKVNLDEWADNEEFVNDLNAKIIKADKIITDELIVKAIKGQVRFDSLESDLQKNFKQIGTSGVYNTVIDGGSIYTGTVTAEKLNIKGLEVKKGSSEAGRTTLKISEDGDVDIRGTIRSFDWNPADTNSTGYEITADGNATFYGCTVRGKVLLPNAGMTNENYIANNESPIRIWAGCTYDDLKNDVRKVPFYVTQNGSLYAQKGTFGGTFSGSLEIGNIRIEDTTTTDGQISINDNNETEVIRFSSDGNSYINNNFRVNNYSFNRDGDELRGINSKFSLENDTNRIELCKGFISGVEGEFHLLNMEGGNAGKHDLYYTNDSSTLNIRGGSVRFTTGNKVLNGNILESANDFELNIEGKFNAAKGASFGGLNIVSNYRTLYNRDNDGNLIESEEIERIDFLM